jgi:hypothetical protein
MAVGPLDTPADEPRDGGAPGGVDEIQRYQRLEKKWDSQISHGVPGVFLAICPTADCVGDELQALRVNRVRGNEFAILLFVEPRALDVEET